MAINVKAPFFLSQKVAEAMIAQGRGGSIINITSEVVERVELNVGPYCPSKAALNSVTKILAKEWGRYGIRVNSLAPCFVDTELNAPLFKQRDWYEAKLKLIPLGRQCPRGLGWRRRLSSLRCFKLHHWNNDTG